MKEENFKTIIYTQKEVIKALNVKDKILTMRTDKNELRLLVSVPFFKKDKKPMTNNDFFLMGVMILIFAGLMLSVFLLNFFYFGIGLFALLVAIFLHSRNSD